MAEPKTKPTDADVGAYLEAVVPAQRREYGRVLVEIFREETGEEPVMWGPSIIGFGSYDSAPARAGNSYPWPKTGFSPRKAQLSIYGLKDLPEGAALLPRLGVYTEGAGCVYVKKLADVDLDVLRSLIRIAASRA